MSIDGFLTCLALLVALYTIAPPVAKLRFRLLGWRIWLPSVLLIGSIFYLLLFKYVGLPCDSSPCTWLILEEESRAPNDIAFLVAVLWLGVLAIAYRTRKFSIRSYSTFRNLVEQLLSDRRYGELVELIEPHIENLAKRASRSHWYQRALDRIRIHGTEQEKWLKLPPDAQKGKLEQSLSKRLIKQAHSLALYALKPIASIFPSKDSAEGHARLVIRRILTHEDFVRYISQERSIFALRLMAADRVDYYDFSDRSLTYMIQPPGGPLRQEIWHNDNISQNFYVIDPDNRIINFLFKDARVAERLEVYRPIGDFAIYCVEEDEAYQRFLNSKPRDFEKAKKSDNLFLSCHFFDIMVRSAVRDKIEWHMWLYYMNLLLARIVKRIDAEAPGYDRDSEFPNYAHFIIYTIIQNLRGWVELFENLEVGHVAARIDTLEARHENGSIVKSAILSIGICVKELLRSENVTDKFISYILEVALRAVAAAQQHANGGRVAQALRNSILEGGPLGLEKDYGRRLLVCFRGMDHIVQSEHGELREELERRFA